MPTPTTRHSLGDQFQGILAAAQEGGEWAVATLYRWLAPAVVGYLRARAGDDAEDLASETWLAVARGLSGFTGDETAFRSWVFTIAHRRLVDLWRRRGRRLTEPVEPADLTGLAGEGDAEADAVDSLSTAEALRAIARLPALQAEVVLLRVLADLPVEEVAAIVGRRPGTVRVIQHRALARLARQAQGRGGDQV